MHRYLPVLVNKYNTIHDKPPLPSLAQFVQNAHLSGLQIEVYWHNIITYTSSAINAAPLAVAAAFPSLLSLLTSIPSTP
jgi:hypothetical protein